MRRYSFCTTCQTEDKHPMKKSKLFLYLTIILAVIEALLTVLQGNLDLPGWITPLNWCLFIATVICLILYFVYEPKER